MFLGNAKPCKAGSLIERIFCCNLSVPTNKSFPAFRSKFVSVISESSEIYYKNLKGKNQSHVKFRYFERATKN